VVVQFGFHIHFVVDEKVWVLFFGIIQRKEVSNELVESSMGSFYLSFLFHLGSFGDGGDGGDEFFLSFFFFFVFSFLSCFSFFASYALM